jgi:hypothetical protein
MTILYCCKCGINEVYTSCLCFKCMMKEWKEKNKKEHLFGKNYD